jgi:translation initiation factor IF-2
MSEDKSIKLFKAAKELNIGTGTIVDFLASKGYKIEKQPNAKIEGEMYDALLKEFQVDKIIKEEAKQISIGKIRREETGAPEHHAPQPHRAKDFEHEEILVKNLHTFTPPAPPVEKPKPVTEDKPKDDGSLPGVKVIGKIDLDNLGKTRPEKKVEEPAAPVAAPKPEPAPEPVQKEEPKPAPVVAEHPKAEVPPVAPAKVEAPAPPAPVVKAETPAPVAPAEPEAEEDEVIRAKAEQLSGPRQTARPTRDVKENVKKMPRAKGRKPMRRDKQIHRDNRARRKAEPPAPSLKRVRAISLVPILGIKVSSLLRQAAKKKSLQKRKFKTRSRQHLHA